MSEAEFAGIESERLILRRFEDSDLAPFVAYRNDPEVARYQSWDSFDEREARAFVQEMRSAQPGVPGDWFQFAVESKETGGLLGDCALQVGGQEPYRAELGFTRASTRGKVSPRKPSRACWITRSTIWGSTGSSPSRIAETSLPGGCSSGWAYARKDTS